jgi:hypothetical protein
MGWTLPQEAKSTSSYSNSNSQTATMESIGVADDKENFHSNICLQDDDHDDHDDCDDEEETSAVVKLKDRRLQAKNRRRRRSSARFLKLEDEDEEEDPPLSSANLGEVYQNAIRMNAENKINASNSWNLNLIDHLDRFVSTSEMKAAVANLQHQQQDGVNFTKASCTLDASVKIYSYRVDDVHLTSYKVLANLNRTETGSSNNNKNKEKHQDSKDSTTTNHRSERRKTTETETLEQNLGKFKIWYMHVCMCVSLRIVSLIQPFLLLLLLLYNSQHQHGQARRSL